MDKLCLFFILGLIVAQTTCMSMRNKRQAVDKVKASNNSVTTALSPSALLDECIRSCLVTPEYNPVCGTDNVTYSNFGRLSCAKACGMDVNLARRSPCPSRT